jgi:hypothetical protein
MMSQHHVPAIWQDFQVGIWYLAGSIRGMFNRHGQIIRGMDDQGWAVQLNQRRFPAGYNLVDVIHCTSVTPAGWECCENLVNADYEGTVLDLNWEDLYWFFCRARDHAPVIIEYGLADTAALDCLCAGDGIDLTTTVLTLIPEGSVGALPIQQNQDFAG